MVATSNVGLSNDGAGELISRPSLIGTSTATSNTLGKSGLEQRNFGRGNFADAMRQSVGTVANKAAGDEVGAQDFVMRPIPAPAPATAQGKSDATENEAMATQVAASQSLRTTKTFSVAEVSVPFDGSDKSSPTMQAQSNALPGSPNPTIDGATADAQSGERALMDVAATFETVVPVKAEFVASAHIKAESTSTSANHGAKAKSTACSPSVPDAAPPQTAVLMDSMIHTVDSCMANSFSGIEKPTSDSPAISGVSQLNQAVEASLNAKVKAAIASTTNHDAKTKVTDNSLPTTNVTLQQSIVEADPIKRTLGGGALDASGGMAKPASDGTVMSAASPGVILPSNVVAANHPSLVDAAMNRSHNVSSDALSAAQATGSNATELSVTTMQTSKPNQLEVGVRGGELGWIRVRAEVGTNGEVNTFLRGASSSITEMLQAKAPQIEAFLGSQDVSVRSVSVERPLSHGADTNTGFTGDAGAASSGSQQQHAHAGAGDEKFTAANRTDSAFNGDEGTNGEYGMPQVSGHVLLSAIEVGSWLSVRA